MCAQITPFTVVSAATPAIRFAEHWAGRRAVIKSSSQRWQSRLPLGKQAANRIFIHCYIWSERPLLPHVGCLGILLREALAAGWPAVGFRPGLLAAAGVLGWRGDSVMVGACGASAQG
jgi:hypothetical protein